MTTSNNIARLARAGLVAAALTLAAGGALAQSGNADDAPIFGSQLMTEQERVEHRQRMRNAASDEERQQIRAEHHERMQQRAQERGVELPASPPADRGMGAGTGQGKGQGKGMGKGKGKGMGQGGGQMMQDEMKKRKGQGQGRN